MALLHSTTLGADLRRRATHDDEVAVAEQTGASDPQARSRSSRKATSYYNTFQTSCTVSSDEPPSYAVAVRAPARPLRYAEDGSERLPKYSCTVGAEGRLLLNLESINPLHGSCEGEWREVYIIIRGTMISFHRFKDGGAGKLLRSYTLQHAEVGLVTDAEHTILVPQTRLAHLIPSAARRRAWQKDPDLFKPVAQHILRLRVETDQILLADGCEEQVHHLIQVLSAAIDISHDIDERSMPRQCTVPRRRRRHRSQIDESMTDPVLLAEQERIFRQMYPDFAGASTRLELPRSENQTIIPQASGREEDELDFSMIREEAAPTSDAPPSDGIFAALDTADGTRPTNVRQTSSTTMHSVHSVDMVYATSTTNFTADGKWQPPHLRTHGQIQRYVRKCMPILNANAARASDILMVDGRRMRLNWRMQLLEQWELQPPTYKSHDFNSSNGSYLARASSQRSTAASAASASQPESQSPSSMLGDCDQIMPLNSSQDALHPTKLASAITTSDKGTLQRLLPTIDDESKIQKSQETTTRPADAHGVVFCF